MTAFDRLSPALGYQIVNTLGFSNLRPVQLLTIDAVLDGCNCVVLAPTAGGKTEAGFFPLLSAMDERDWRPVSLIYLSPIRALLNNQEARVERYAGLIGRRAFKWHGDTGPSQRKRFIADPSDVLLTTPESLEAMLMSLRVPARALFAGLEAVIIDEVHAFADDDRGAHLCALLERLGRFCGRDIQRLGLSATVGNPDEILRWLQGSSSRPGRVISPPKPAIEPKLSLDYVATPANAATVIARLHPGRKRLVFVDSRRGVEELGKLLRQAEVDTYVTHGSLSASSRRDAEQAFERGRDCVIAATSALELGIDVGDLDHVLQLDSPPSVASFLQRMGRTGRRSGTVPNCTFLATKDKAVLQAAAILRLHRAGFVEPVRPSRAAYHILAHQLLAMAIEREGVARDRWWPALEGATAFADISVDEREAIVDHMLAQGILAETSAKLWLGPRGERLYGRRNFAELYAVFSTPRLITVRWIEREIGTVDAQFLAGNEDEPGRSTFTLAGRAWRITHVDWRRALCLVEPTDQAGNTRWSGSPQYLGYALCQAMREILVDDADDPSWSQRAREVVAALRCEHEFLRDSAAPMVVTGEEISWWTWAGGRANLLLAKLMEAELGGTVIVRNESLTCRGAAGQSIARLQEWLTDMRAAGRPTLDDALRLASSAARSRVSKFEPCLPELVLERLSAEMVVDLEGALAVVCGRVDA
jgi:ATP-dependent helicase Lhr and Lhr-like helicase